jgi:hypothetical protein
MAEDAAEAICAVERSCSQTPPPVLLPVQQVSNIKTHGNGLKQWRRQPQVLRTSGAAESVLVQKRKLTWLAVVGTHQSTKRLKLAVPVQTLARKDVDCLRAGLRRGEILSMEALCLSTDFTVLIRESDDARTNGAVMKAEVPWPAFGCHFFCFDRGPTATTNTLQIGPLMG